MTGKLRLHRGTSCAFENTLYTFCILDIDIASPARWQCVLSNVSTCVVPVAAAQPLSVEGVGSQWPREKTSCQAEKRERKESDRRYNQAKPKCERKQKPSDECEFEKIS